MINKRDLKFLAAALLISVALCYGYWRFRGIDNTAAELKKSEQAVEEMRLDVNDLQTRVDQTRERVKALESDPVEAEGVARGLGKAVRKKSETIYQVDESRLHPVTTVAPSETSEAAKTTPPAAPAGK